jgi:hypothetical protein
MSPIKMSWHSEDGRLMSEWAQLQTPEPYTPAWMQSSYPSEADAQRSRPNLWTPSAFGKPGIFLSRDSFVRGSIMTASAR